jgi:hypothetical protein
MDDIDIYIDIFDISMDDTTIILDITDVDVVISIDMSV